ncbi:hypothetical protein C8J57DRAFT_1548656 [Mycena rebaudengoi]|nr:hypothetical protein C8J57DRAFT_1548656 [Mycena rebaudengoi]
MFALQSFVIAGFYVAAVLATTIPAFPPLKVDKVIDAAAYMGNLTAVESNVEKRTLGNSFLCTGAGFTGNCVLITGEQNGGCVNLGTRPRQASLQLRTRSGTKLFPLAVPGLQLIQLGKRLGPETSDSRGSPISPM